MYGMIQIPTAFVAAYPATADRRDGQAVLPQAKGRRHKTSRNLSIFGYPVARILCLFRIRILFDEASQDLLC